jgi:hypothetical protein
MKLVGAADATPRSAAETRAALTRPRPAILDVRSSSAVIDLRDAPAAAGESFTFDDGLFVDMCAPAPKTEPVESEMLRILRGDLDPSRRTAPPPRHRRP